MAAFNIPTSATDANLQRLVEHAMLQAETSMENKDFHDALCHLSFVAKFAPSKKDEIKSLFIIAFQEQFKALEGDNQTDKIFKMYDVVLQLFPECESVLNEMGSQLFRLGYVDEAAHCFRKAVKIDSCFLGARENLENICSHLVERWHFRMLNDQHRNQAYKDTICTMLTKGHKNVLDVGSGTGLLSMFAIESGADNVYACELSKTMYELSCDVLKANKLADFIKIFHAKSTSLSVPKDIPERVDLIVTEVFDAGLLGEGILPTLEHAWENLLTQKGIACVVPYTATVYVCAIESETIRHQHRFVYSAVPYIDLSSVTIGSKEAQGSEPYTSEKLSRIRNGFKRLTKKQKLCQVDFNDLKGIRAYINGKLMNIDLSVIKNGRVDAIALWFDLHADDDLMISTSPDSISCWEQAIYPISNTKENSLVRIGDSILLNCRSTVDHFEIKYSDIIRAKNETSNNVNIPVTKSRKQPSKKRGRRRDRKHSNVIEMKTPDCDIESIVSIFDGKHPVFYVESEDISRLNDIKLNANFCSALEEIFNRYKKENPNPNVTLVDLIKGLSTTGLQALKLGYSKVLHIESSDVIHNLLKLLCNDNGLSEDRLTFGNKNFEDYGNDWSIVVTDLIEPCGALRQMVLEDIAMARLTLLKEGGRILPNSVDVYAMLINSPELEECSRVVDNERVLGLDIATLMNDFQMTTHVDIDIFTLPHTRLSQSIKIFELNLNEPHSEEIPSFLKQSHKYTLEAIECGRISAVVYWFDLHLTEKVQVQTLDINSHWKLTGVMQKEDLDVSTGQSLTLHATLRNSCIDLKVDLFPNHSDS